MVFSTLSSQGSNLGYITIFSDPDTVYKPVSTLQTELQASSFYANQDLGEKQDPPTARKWVSLALHKEPAGRD